MVSQKSCKSIRITSKTPTRIRNWNQFSHFRLTSTTITSVDRKDLNWLHFDDEPKVQERQKEKD